MACLDSTMLYVDDDDPEKACIKFVDTMSPNQNIYIGVAIRVSKLSDPVLKNHVKRDRKLLSQTYWANSANLEMQHAALPLATCGKKSR